MTKNNRPTRPARPTRSIQSARPIPTIGGQPAGAVYDLIERASSIALVDGVPLVTVDADDLCDEHDALWRSAYDDMERELMAEMVACSNQHDHHDMSELEWASLVTHSVADRARELLGIRDVHPFWC